MTYAIIPVCVVLGVVGWVAYEASKQKQMVKYLVKRNNFLKFKYIN